MKYLSILVITAISALSGVSGRALPSGESDLIKRAPESDVASLAARAEAGSVAKSCPRKGGGGKSKVKRDVLAALILDWQVGEHYDESEVVRYQGRTYTATRSNTANTMNHPGSVTSPGLWVECNV